MLLFYIRDGGIFFLTFEGTVNSRTGCHPPVTRQQFEHIERFGFESDNNLKFY